MLYAIYNIIILIIFLEFIWPDAQIICNFISDRENLIFYY